MSRTNNILITQCLQNDFVQALPTNQALPNLLHIGPDESRRLMGENPNMGPVGQIMDWANKQSADNLAIIHIRDWHNSADLQQQKHLNQFGNHCIQETEGAKFVFKIKSDSKIIDSITLNDFIGTDLQAYLDRYSNQVINVGIMGVWTEAKITFLAYEIATRYPQFNLAVCSALTASSSRSQHFLALQQLAKIIGVSVIDSIGEFIRFLGGKTIQPALISFNRQQPSLLLDEELKLSTTEINLIKYLFRDCKKVQLDILDGGFSGNLVAKTQSFDNYGHEQSNHVIKIGPQKLMGQERIAFEQIEAVLGNNAPQIAEFADLEDRGAIKYRYASMAGEKATTFQQLYCSDCPIDKILGYIDEVFNRQLGRLYLAAHKEKNNLLEYYCFDSCWAESVKKSVDALKQQIPFSTSENLPDLYQFYREGLDTLNYQPKDYYFSFVHGDLNGANIIIDDNDNIWLIDFFSHPSGSYIKRLPEIRE